MNRWKWPSATLKTEAWVAEFNLHRMKQVHDEEEERTINADTQQERKSTLADVLLKFET